MRSSFLLVLISTTLTIITPFVRSSSTSPTIQARIKTPWSGSTLFIQFLESLSLSSPDTFHPFLIHLLESQSTTTTTSERTTYRHLFHQLDSYLSSSSASLARQHATTNDHLAEMVELSLGLKESNVAIETMRSLVDRDRNGTECEDENWVRTGGSIRLEPKTLRTSTELRDWIQQVHHIREWKSPKIYPFDHPYPPQISPNSSLPYLIFYASPHSTTFADMYTTLIELAQQNRLEFILRWNDRKMSEKEPLYLSGYGAGLDIKKSDYLAIDDRLSDDLELGHDSIEQGEKMEPVKKRDIELLALRATSYILSSSNPLSTFKNLTSSFPLLASKLSSLIPEIPIDLNDELISNSINPITTNQRPLFYFNGLNLPDSLIDPFSLLRLMRKETKFILQLFSLCPTSSSYESIRTLLINPLISEGMKGRKYKTLENGRVSQEVLGDLFDASDRIEEGRIIFWWNDLRKDKRYQDWSRDLKELLRPNYPGQMTKLGLNLNQIIFILDLSQTFSLALIVEQIRTFVNRGIPLRFGIVPLSSEGVSHEIAAVFTYLTEAVGRGKTMQFLIELAQDSSTSERISSEQLDRIYSDFRIRNAHSMGGPLASSIGEIVELTKFKLNKIREYCKRLGIVSATNENEIKPGAFFINGAFFELDVDWASNLQRVLASHVQFEQQEVYFETLNSSIDISNYFYDFATTRKRRNRFIFVTETNPLKIVNLFDVSKSIDADFFERSWIEYVGKKEEEELKPLLASLWVVADLDVPEGRELVKSSLQYLDHHSEARINLVHNPSIEANDQKMSSRWSLSNLLYLLNQDQAIPNLLPSEMLDWLELDLNQDTVDIAIASIEKKWDDDNPIKKYVKLGAGPKIARQAREYWKSSQLLAKKFGFEPGQLGLVLNGRVIGPFKKDEIFHQDDFEAFVSYEREKRIDPIHEAIKNSKMIDESIDRFTFGRMITFAGSIIAEAYEADPGAGLSSGRSTVERSREYLDLAHKHSAFIGPNEEQALFEIAVVVDPATETAQRWAPIIETLSKLNSVHLRIYFNPSPRVKDLPIKRFYAFTFSTSLEFDPVSGKPIEPQVQFSNIPEDVLLTFAMDTPKAWLTFPKKSVHDLDNIRLKDLPSWARKIGVDAEFELESLVVEGHAREMPAGSPPRGLQLELVKAKMGQVEEQRVDTIVMANLGYFQFKASPGLWKLALRPGKSSEVYTMESTGADGWNTGSVQETGDEIVVSTLEGMTLYPRFTRNSGHETTELLDDSAKHITRKTEMRVLDRVKNMIPFMRKADLVIKKKAEINVFTVASGLLYERMAFLMVVSVMRHTKSTVKFWFIQNFLSPSFRAFIPHMAQEYGFEYELVTYKWPDWLRAQKEKQRTIWGYKILFLDVLFPLELERVIFVDSDQIVRTDLKQLVDLNLEGAPYAYTPMGDDRPEMDPYRFWKTGYWKDHLRGRPYHISALYVIDLDRFRAIAAGDRLRQQYQGLSADPNSLANLDQDLPNNMQDSIPIYTLDQSWLWCETWCSDASLATAKTIDLCNNPLTHEPKLRRAKRLIPEWTEIDNEVAALAKRVAQKESQDDIGVFGGKADELGQAKGQKEELDEFVKEKIEEGTKVELKPIEVASERAKDEL